ncbi:hypothetical protein JW960_18765, partial [candidate division KSB1 bacterium]|nr:hypothetical protein [candidate division KSB1 bacterium]
SAKSIAKAQIYRYAPCTMHVACIALPSNIERIPDVCRDVDDNNLLQSTVFVNADFIITGDKD